MTEEEIKIVQEVRGQIANLEHEQWMRWAKNILPELKFYTKNHLPYNEEKEAGNCACKTCQRIKRWEPIDKSLKPGVL